MIALLIGVELGIDFGGDEVNTGSSLSSVGRFDPGGRGFALGSKSSSICEFHVVSSINSSTSDSGSDSEWDGAVWAVSFPFLTFGLFPLPFFLLCSMPLFDNFAYLNSSPCSEERIKPKLDKRLV